MNWFRNNPLWGGITVALAVVLLLSAAVLWWTKGNFDAEQEQYNATMASLAQLESSNPYPSTANAQQMKTYLQNYRSSLDTFKTELSQHVIPVKPLPPNEFQMHLREALTAASANARLHRVKLPDNFNLGFPEFVAALPSATDAPKLGQELAQIQLLLNMIIEAHVDAIRTFRRASRDAGLASASPASPSPRAAIATSAPKPLERNTVEFAISGSPVSVRRVINDISTATDQFMIIRSLHVKNQRDKGPPRENGTEAAATATPSPTTAENPPPTSTASPPPITALNFIVGNEHLDLSAKVEMVNFAP